MRKKNYRILLIIFSLISETTLAARMFGVSDCGQWLNPKNAMARVEEKAWLMGYLSGINGALVNGTLKGKLIKEDPLYKLNSAEQAVSWMDKYCRENPLKNVGEGGMTLWLDLKEMTSQ